MPPHIELSGDNDRKVSFDGKDYREENISFDINSEIMSRHLMLIGGTGCGKTNTFFHIINQLKRQMDDNDVMIIFDTKRDYYNKFFNKERDCVLSSRNIYAETLGTETLFNTLLGRTESLFVTQHSDALASKKFSESFGKYLKLEISKTYTSGTSYPGYCQILPVEGYREIEGYVYVERARVEEVEITRAHPNDVFIRKNGIEIHKVRCSEGNVLTNYSTPKRKSKYNCTFNIWVFSILLIFCFPLSFIYGFFTTGRRGKIVFGITILLFIAIILLVPI